VCRFGITKGGRRSGRILNRGCAESYCVCLSRNGKEAPEGHLFGLHDGRYICVEGVIIGSVDLGVLISTLGGHLEHSTEGSGATGVCDSQGLMLTFK
jgi:hypothetical protein